MNNKEGDKKCCHLRKNGVKCEAWAMKDSDFCYLHNPEISEEKKREAMAKGGKNNKPIVTTPLETTDINSPIDILSVITTTITELRAGKIDSNIAKSIFYGCGCYLKAYETADMEAKMSKIEFDLDQAEKNNFYNR